MALTPEQTKELEGMVEERRSALLAEVREGLGRVRADGLDNVVGAVPDPGDESVQSLIQDLDQAEARRDLRELQTIEVARRRIADGSYGTCIDCGQDIGFPRQRATPAAERCIQCQTIFEKTHAGPGGSTL